MKKTNWYGSARLRLQESRTLLYIHAWESNLVPAALVCLEDGRNLQELAATRQVPQQQLNSVHHILRSAIILIITYKIGLKKKKKMLDMQRLYLYRYSILYNALHICNFLRTRQKICWNEKSDNTFFLKHFCTGSRSAVFLRIQIPGRAEHKGLHIQIKRTQSWLCDF